MKSRQYSVRVYETEIDNDEEFIEFFKINSVLLKNNLILLKGEVSNKIQLFLKSLSLDFIINPNLSKSFTKNINIENNLKEVEKQKELESEKDIEIEIYKKEIALNQSLLNEKNKNLNKNNITILDSLIRSGKQVNIDGDLVLFSRINSGASVYVNGNFIATQLIEGKVLCNGDFMLFNSSPKAYIEFHGIELTNSLNNKLNKVEFKNNEIIITPVLKEEINWVTS